MQRPETKPWLPMSTRVRVGQRPFGWGYLAFFFVGVIGVAAIVNAERHEMEHRARRRR